MSQRFAVRTGNRDQGRRKRGAEIIVAAYREDEDTVEVLDPVRKVFRVRRRREGNHGKACPEVDDMDLSAPSSYCIVDLWTESCTCPSTLIPCKHLVAVRMLLKSNMIEGIDPLFDEETYGGVDGNDTVDADNEVTNEEAQVPEGAEGFTQSDVDTQSEMDDTEFEPSVLLAKEKAIVEQEKLKLLEKVQFAMERCDDRGGYGRIASALRAAQNLMDVCLGINAGAQPEAHNMGQHRSIDLQQAHVKATRLGARAPKARPERARVHRAAGYRGNKRSVLGRAFSQLEKIPCAECTYHVVIPSGEESNRCPNCNTLVDRSSA